MKTSARISKPESDSSVHSSRQNRKNNSFSLFGHKENEMFFSPAALQPKLEIGQPDDPFEREADRVADQVMRMSEPAAQANNKPSQEPSLQFSTTTNENRIQRQGNRPNYSIPEIAGIQIRSPALEETLRQGSLILGYSEAGRGMTDEEIELARPIFGNSIKYEKVRIVAYGLSNELSTEEEGKQGFDTKGTYMVLGNVIFVPPEFSIANRRMAQTLIHELVHVWQYQTGGTSYISSSIVAQISGSAGSGSRNAAYGYQVIPGKTFFDYGPEQQGLIVENYFAMLNDQQIISDSSVDENDYDFYSNHLTSSGNLRSLTPEQRMDEIQRELPWHHGRIEELRTVVPMTELKHLHRQTGELFQTPGQDLGEIPAERQMIPLRPILEFRW
jgi:hypothetical protein